MYAAQYEGDSRAAQALMAAELARQSLKAHRVFSDGTVLPTSVEDSQVQNRQEKAATVLNPAIDDRHRSNNRQAL
jgi:conjugal transfer mating pair stabilization protein TraG